MENYCRQKDGYKESFSKNMVVPRAKSKGWNSERRNIHRTGSVKGMVKLGFWSQDSDKVRHGNYIYEQP